MDDDSDHGSQTDQGPDISADRVQHRSHMTPTSTSLNELPQNGALDGSVREQESMHPPPHLDPNDDASRPPEHQESVGQEVTAQQAQNQSMPTTNQSVLDLIAGLVGHAAMPYNASAHAAAGPSGIESLPWNGLLTYNDPTHPQTQPRTLPPLQNLLTNLSGSSREGSSTPGTNNDHSQLLLPLLTALVNTNASQESSPVESGAHVETASLLTNAGPVIGSQQQYLAQGAPRHEDMVNDLTSSGVRSASGDHQDAVAPYAKRRKSSNDPGKRKQSDGSQRDPRERRTPCRRRGMPDYHNIKTAYLVIPHNVRHGDNLECSIPECRDGGPRFRYCAICQSPVATCNFTTRHNHHPEEFGRSVPPYASLGSSSSTVTAGLTAVGNDAEVPNPANPSLCTTPPKPALKPGTKKWAKDQVEAVVRVGNSWKETPGQTEQFPEQGSRPTVDKETTGQGKRSSEAKDEAKRGDDKFAGDDSKPTKHR